MSLIAETKKLRELEQQATPGEWFPGYLETGCIAGDGGRGEVVLRKTNGGEMPIDENLAFICKSRNLAPAMLEVLGCFRAGDAEKLAWILSETIDNGSELRGMLERFQQMAAIMEKEEQ